MRKLLPVGFVLCAVLGGCQTYEQVDLRTRGLAERHPITVAPQIAELRLVPDPVTKGLSAADRARLSTFLAEFKTGSDADLSIAAPDGSANARLAARTAGQVRDIASGSGLPIARIRLGSYPAVPGDAAAPIVVSYVSYLAKGPECGHFATNLADNPSNQVSPNFGCAMQKNLAAMLADPRDLIVPRAETPADALRRQTVLDKYRQGQSTQTQRQNDERGIVSTVGSN